MNRKQVLAEIKQICEQRYAQVEDWNHDIYHVKRVVKLSKKIAEKEGLKEKDVFCVELAAWLHDLGRVGEDKGQTFFSSNHAEKSYRQSRNIIKKYSRYIGYENIYKILQAVREHSKGILDHRDNVIAKCLQDGDRGASINLIGCFSILDYKEMVKIVDPVRSVKEARMRLRALIEEIKEKGINEEAWKMLENLRVFYYGEKKNDKWVVLPLHTKSAKKMFKKNVKEIEEIMSIIK